MTGIKHARALDDFDELDREMGDLSRGGEPDELRVSALVTAYDRIHEELGLKGHIRIPSNLEPGERLEVLRVHVRCQKARSRYLLRHPTHE